MMEWFQGIKEWLSVGLPDASISDTEAGNEAVKACSSEIAGV